MPARANREALPPDGCKSVFVRGGRPQNERAACPSITRPADGVAGGDTQDRADARSEAPAPVSHSPRCVAASGGKHLGRGSLRLRVYRMGAVCGLPHGTDRRDSGAQMLNGMGFSMQEKES